MHLEGGSPMAKVRRIDLSFDEFIAGTIGLSDVEMGIFWRACLLIYSRSGPIDRRTLRKACDSQARTFNRCLDRLLEGGKLIEKEGKLTQNRCQTEIKLASNRAETSAKNLANRWRKPLKNKETPHAAPTSFGDT